MKSIKIASIVIVCVIFLPRNVQLETLLENISSNVGDIASNVGERALDMASNAISMFPGT